MRKDPHDQAASTDEAKKSDMEAFAAAFEPHRPAVFGVACRLVGPDEAEDVVMDTFLRAWEALPRFGRRSSLRTWLYRLAYNCAIDRIRRRHRRKEEPLEGGDARSPTAGEIADERQVRPDEAAAEADLAEQVRGALARLSDEHRTALLLRYADGLSYAEIGAATGVSVGTVMSRLFYAKRRLRQRMEGKVTP